MAVEVSQKAMEGGDEEQACLDVGATVIALLSGGASFVYKKYGLEDAISWVEEVLGQSSSILPRVVKMRTGHDLKVEFAMRVATPVKEKERKEDDSDDQTDLERRLRRR
jgi:hypothetical protein